MKFYFLEHVDWMKTSSRPVFTPPPAAMTTVEGEASTPTAMTSTRKATSTTSTGTMTTTTTPTTTTTTTTYYNPGKD